MQYKMHTNMENMHEDIKCVAVENEDGFKELKNAIKHSNLNPILQSPIMLRTTLRMKAETIMSGSLQKPIIRGRINEGKFHPRRISDENRMRVSNNWKWNSLNTYMEKARAEHEAEIRENRRDINLRGDRREFHQNPQPNPFCQNNKKIPLNKFKELYMLIRTAQEKDVNDDRDHNNKCKKTSY